MEIISQHFQTYIVVLGILLLVLASLEFIFPFVILSIWKKWLNNRFFPLHGLLLILGGFPTTQFRDTFFGKVMLIVGIIIVFMGPFILFFPDRVRHFFYESIKDLNGDEIKHLVYVDGAMRAMAGILFLFVILSR